MRRPLLKIPSVKIDFKHDAIILPERFVDNFVVRRTLHIPLRFQARIEGVAQSVAEKVDGKHCKHDGKTGKDR